jgi:hypothetical protein
VNFLSKFGRAIGHEDDREDRHLRTLIPGVADAEEDAGVVAGIVVAEAGVGWWTKSMQNRRSGRQTNGSLRRVVGEVVLEVLGGGIGGREQDATSKMEYGMACGRGEVPSREG